jgi:hypothetical protein
MFETVNEPVRVLAGFSYENGRAQVMPYVMDWRKQRYRLGMMGLHHPARQGNRYVHIFEFAVAEMKFKLTLDSETLLWTLTEVYYDHSA